MSYQLTFTTYKIGIQSILAEADDLEMLTKSDAFQEVIKTATPSGPYDDGDLTEGYLANHKFLCVARDMEGYYMVEYQGKLKRSRKRSGANNVSN